MKNPFRRGIPLDPEPRIIPFPVYFPISPEIHKADIAELRGQEVEVAFGIRSSEANGKHYTNLRGWGVSTITAAPVQTVAPIGEATQGAAAPTAPPTTTGNPALEDLPF